MTIDWRVPISRSGLLAGLAAALLLLATLPAPLAAAASPTACRVRNLDTGFARRTLQAAVDLAAPGQRLTVQGTCHGITYIDKDLSISGVRTRLSGRPTLDGDQRGTVVRVFLSKVALRKLTIRGGAERFGGGIHNVGDLRLRDVRVRGNIAVFGGGIANEDGSLVVSGSSSISGNRAFDDGGGVWNVAKFTLRAPATITSNRASIGGGIWSAGGGTLEGVVCGTNVTGNVPDDCVGP